MYLYHIKRRLNRFFKRIHNLFLLFGINISFVKKHKYVSAIDQNSIDEANKAYSSKEYQIEVLSNEHQAFFEEILKFIESKKIIIQEKNVADFGCGVGNILWHINKKYPSAVLNGYDFSEKALEVALKRLPHANFKSHDIYSIIDERFDIIFCTEVLEHLLYPHKALQNLISMSNPSATIILTVPNGRIDTYEGHINFWSSESWKVFIEENISGNKSETGNLKSGILYALISIDNS